MSAANIAATTAVTKAANAAMAAAQAPAKAPGTARATGRTARFWDSSIGKKAVMAVTGVIMVGFLLGHVSGNLLMYRGPEAMDAYAKFLHSLGGLLWAVRGVLLASVVLHVVAAVQLARRARTARGGAQGYQVHEYQVATFASRYIRWGGFIILTFVIFHLLHFTTGDLHPDFREHEVYRNVVVGFQRPLVSAFYLLAMAAVGLHLYHGVWSSSRTLGLAPVRPQPMVRRVATVLSLVVWAGFTSIPLAVLFGLITV